MALTWWLVAIAGMVALAACVAVALLSPSTRERRQPVSYTHLTLPTICSVELGGGGG